MIQTRSRIDVESDLPDAVGRLKAIVLKCSRLLKNSSTFANEG